jgi:hypothetical protein
MAKQKQCDKGHYYDPKKYSSCPYCGVPGLDVQPDAPSEAGEDTVTVGHSTESRPVVDSGEVTVGIYRKELGMDPVVGWLVCVDGPDRGRDYRIRSEKNFIGRSEKMNICIHGDETISRENHAIVSYNPRNQTFKLLPGESRGLIYLNKEEVDVPQTLNPYDQIELGKTTLVFVPLCGEKFKWGKN